MGTCFAYTSNLIISCYISVLELPGMPKIICQYLDYAVHLGVLVPRSSNGRGHVQMSESTWKPSAHMFSRCWGSNCWIIQSPNNKSQLYSASTAVLERLSHFLYNRLLTFQIQIGIFEYSNKAVFSPSENFKRGCIKEKALSAPITLLHNEN